MPIQTDEENLTKSFSSILVPLIWCTYVVISSRPDAIGPGVFLSDENFLVRFHAHWPVRGIERCDVQSHSFSMGARVAWDAKKRVYSIYGQRRRRKTRNWVTQCTHTPRQRNISLLSPLVKRITYGTERMRKLAIFAYGRWAQFFFVLKSDELSRLLLKFFAQIVLFDGFERW